MDTSETYVKMCEKAVEIQELSDTEGFRSTNLLNNIFYNINIHNFETTYCYKHKNNVWLPRQDQLQEIIKTDDIILDCSKFFSFVAFYTCERDRLDQVKKQTLSMEQLWLAFVMSQKYGKTWNGGDWRLANTLLEME